MVSRTFAWLATGGGAWGLASNWDDVTDNIDPSLIVPGLQDNVIIGGPTGSTVQTITGQGDVLTATFSGNTVLAGDFAATGVTFGAGSAGGLLDIGAGGTLDAGALDAQSGSVLASGGAARLAVTGTLTLGAGQSGLDVASANLYASNGGIIQVGALVLDASSAVLYADPTGSIEVGTTGGAVAGALTVDRGAMLIGQGDANAYGAVINNGTITASQGTLLVGTLTGTGQLSIDAGAELTLNGPTGAGQALLFAGSQATLALASEFYAPSGLISGFATGDAIDELGSPISAATWVQSNASQGVLTLWYGGQVADSLALAGNYAGDIFLTAGDGALGTLITVAPAGGGGGTASAGTAGPDVYQWVASGGGSWNSAANWRDVTTGAQPAAIAPGQHDLVTVAAGQGGSFAVITGPANAAALTLTGDVALVGAFAVGTLTVGQGGANPTNAVLDLVPGTTLTAATAWLADGGLTAAGSAVLSVAGTLTLGGGSPGIGLPITALSATAGGTITAASLVMGGGSGDSVITDPTGVIEIGTLGGAASGAVTIDAGAQLTGNGEVNPFGLIVDNGTILATGGLLWLGSVTGTGVLDISAGAALELQSSTAVGIAFTGANGVLAVADEFVALTGTISGFADGDSIDILGDPITAVQANSSATASTLSLYYGSTLVDRFILSGNYTKEKFLLAPDGAGGTEILTAPSGGGGGGGGQGNTDLLVWAQPGNGPWSHASNWFDATTGAPATAAPGSENPVQIAGPASGGYQIITGPGVCASLAFFGDTLLNGAFTTGNLAVGGTLAGSFTTALLAVGASSGVTASSAQVAGGTLLLSSSGGALDVGGTLILGASDTTLPASVLAASNGASVDLGGLQLAGGGILTCDLTSTLEIGTLGGAVAGAVTIDPGITVAGAGSFNVGGAVIDNGTLCAQGGALFVGAVSGNGVLTIAGEASLWLTAGVSVGIDFTGGGGALVLQGTEEAPAGIISGFAAGDQIITGSSQVDSVTYAPGAGGIGTLTLYFGGAVAGTLLLAGNYSGDVFTVQPDGDGTEIAVQASSGPSGGTTTPDDYVWTGLDGTLWNDANNWNDLSAGQSPAAIAPGAEDLVTVQGGSGVFTTIQGPADAAALTLLGEVALLGQYSIGVLNVGSGTAAGVLALGAAAVVQAASTAVTGGLELSGGALATSGTLTLQAGALQATSGARVTAGALILAGAGSALTVDATASIEVGNEQDATEGAVTVDQGATLQGEGAVNPLGETIDQGTITASAGTLVLGTLLGTGVLDVGVGATMELAGTAAASLTVDFAGAGTLSLLNTLPQAYIAGFGAGSSILLPLANVTEAEYAPTEPNTGVLLLLNNGTVVGQLTLLGVGQDQTFSVTGAPGGETLLTTTTEIWGGGGSTVRSGTGATGSGQFGILSGFSFFQGLSDPVQLALEAVVDGLTTYLYTSPTGDSVTNWAPFQGGYANIAIVSDPVALTKVVLPSGYVALLAQGNAPITLTDGGSAGGVLLLGNAGNDTIVGFGADDTLAGSPGGNNVFFADQGDVIYGSGNDTIVTQLGNCSVTTALNSRSIAFLGAADNIITLYGRDTVVAVPGNGANDTVVAIGADTVFAPSVGQLTHEGGDAADIVVGTGGGTIQMYGGTGNGSILWCAASPSIYYGGAGTASIVGGSAPLSVQGGQGAITVFAGIGNTTITGAAGPSEFAVGAGAATVTAASGNLIWAAGAGNESLVASGGDVTIWGANSTGNNVFQAGSGPCILQGGTGRDTFLGGAGSATMNGGGGADMFAFTNGLGGGNDQIFAFSPGADTITLYGYGSYSSALVNGSEVLTLTDGTHITLSGISSLTGVTIITG